MHHPAEPASADASARRPRWTDYAGILVTVAALVLTEILRIGVGAPTLVTVTVLIASFVGVAYAGLRGGFAHALVAAVLVALYTVRYSTLVGWYEVTGRTLSGALVMLVIGALMGGSMALIKRREDAFKHELREKARTLEERNRELAEANEMLEAFTYVVSHDLKEPVRAIATYLEVTEEEWGTPEGRTFLARAHQANDRLITLLRGLLDYSRTSLAAASSHDVRLGAVLDSEATRTMFESVLDERGGVIEVDELPVVRGDDVVLSQLFGNIILNALKHNPNPRPRVVVRALANAPPGRAHLVVDDNGPGFSPDVLHRFGQLKGTRPSTVKGGFGLTISQRAAQRLGGRLWLDRSPEGGARVHVELPSPQAATRDGRARILPQGRQ